jgi:general secretion pathway protein G
VNRTRSNNKAFTLVEILIVVVILGILAAIVVPQFTNAANEARSGNLSSQLKTLQNQIELFAAQNNGAYPDLSANWDVMLDGNFIKDEPTNPAWPTAETRSSVSEAAEGTGSEASAWLFNTDEGRLYASFYIEPWIADADNPTGATQVGTD